MTELLFYLGLGIVLTSFLSWLWSRKLGFLAQRPEDYAATTPVFNLREHLNGPVVCEGMIYGPLGRVSSRFVADMNVTWDGNVGTMDEHFRYDSGTTQKRQWILTVGNDGRIKANADDVIGDGEGTISGSTIQLRYKFRLPESAGGYVLDTVDWMYLVENGTIVNHSQFRKYGIKVAELVATFRKVEQAA